MRIAVDTTVFVYASAYDNEARRSAALDLLRRLPKAQVVTPIQVLGELFNVLTRKLRLPAAEATSTVVDWSSVFAVAEMTAVSFLHAVEIAAVHRLRLSDATILATAAEAGCGLLLSEELREGFAWGGVVVTNPFQAKRHVWLETLLDDGGSVY